MADKKISAETAIVTLAGGDKLPIVDISEASDANKNKSVTISQISTYVQNALDLNEGILEAKSTSYSVLVTDTGKVFTNSGASTGSVTFTLPNPGNPTTLGNQVIYTFASVDSGDLFLQLPSGHTLNGSTASIKVKAQRLFGDDAAITIRNISSTKWISVSGMGDWIHNGGTEILADYGLKNTKKTNVEVSTQTISLDGYVAEERFNKHVIRVHLNDSGNATRTVSFPTASTRILGQEYEVIIENTSGISITVGLSGVDAVKNITTSGMVMADSDIIYLKGVTYDTAENIMLTDNSYDVGLSAAAYDPAATNLASTDTITLAKAKQFMGTESSPITADPITVSETSSINGAEVYMYHSGSSFPVLTTPGTLDVVGLAGEYSANSVNFIGFQYHKAGSGNTQLHYKIENLNQAPVATGVTIEGTKSVGNVVSIDFSYSDAENDAEDTTAHEYEFYRCDDTDRTNAVKISTNYYADTFTLTASELGKYLYGRVRPHAQTGSLQGVWSTGDVTATTVAASSTVIDLTSAYSVHNETGSGGTIGTQTDASGITILRLYDSGDAIDVSTTINSTGDKTIRLYCRTGTQTNGSSLSTYYGIQRVGGSDIQTNFDSTTGSYPEYGGVTYGWITGTMNFPSTGSVTIRITAETSWLMVMKLEINEA